MKSQHLHWKGCQNRPLLRKGGKRYPISTKLGWIDLALELQKRKQKCMAFAVAILLGWVREVREEAQPAT